MGINLTLLDSNGIFAHIQDICKGFNLKQLVVYNIICNTNVIFILCFSFSRTDTLYTHLYTLHSCHFGILFIIHTFISLAQSSVMCDHWSPPPPHAVGCVGGVRQFRCSQTGARFNTQRNVRVASLPSNVNFISWVSIISCSHVLSNCPGIVSVLM